MQWDSGSMFWKQYHFAGSCFDFFLGINFNCFTIMSCILCNCSLSCFPLGLVLIPAAALGQIISGVLVSKCKMDCKGIIKFTIRTYAVALTLNAVFLFAKCGNEPFAGVSETYNG